MFLQCAWSVHRAFNQRYPFIVVEFTKAPTVVRFGSFA